MGTGRLFGFAQQFAGGFEFRFEGGNPCFGVAAGLIDGLQRAIDRRGGGTPSQLRFGTLSEGGQQLLQGAPIAAQRKQDRHE